MKSGVSTHNNGEVIAKVASVYTIIIAVIKIFTGIFTMSIAILTDGLHSIIDGGGAVIAQYSYHLSKGNPDHEHPFGHGKIEGVASLIEMLLIYITAGFIIYEGVLRLIYPVKLDYLLTGIIIMIISCIGNYFVAYKMKSIGLKTKSIILQTEAFHLTVDAYTSLGVVMALFLIKITGLYVIDSITSIVIILVAVGFTKQLITNSLSILIDKRIPEEEEKRILNIINRHRKDFVNIHDLRNRFTGNGIALDMHMTLHRNSMVGDAHRICDVIEQDLKKNIKNIDVIIHIEPCRNDCALCKSDKR
ncbi:MAG: cation diffusion facilitator family transporter [Candidatus Thermoplasmatota archaeon]|jgi:cation diffusion facilitator family transporter|nr:cation diffusion facilitator family transporter [Candidatus Thermoplasmatota archaeon]MCL5963856.1 cation diffusion facilitator family transporter [Candidatus Thermoplasmatota archaeon]